MLQQKSHKNGRPHPKPQPQVCIHIQKYEYVYKIWILSEAFDSHSVNLDAFCSETNTKRRRIYNLKMAERADFVSRQRKAFLERHNLEMKRIEEQHKQKLEYKLEILRFQKEVQLKQMQMDEEKVKLRVKEYKQKHELELEILRLKKEAELQQLNFNEEKSKLEMEILKMKRGNQLNET